MKSIWEKIKLAFNRKHEGNLMLPVESTQIKKVRVRKKKETTDASK